MVSVNETSVKNLLYNAQAIRQRVSELAVEIAAGLPSGDLVLIGILRGSFVFLADLVRELHRHGVSTQIDFMMLQSYGAGTVSNGDPKLIKDFTLDVSGHTVLLVDDILDTGRTLDFAARHIRERGADLCKTCVLLDKPARRTLLFQADYVGFEVPDVFIVGYGLDFNGRCREWPYLAQLESPAT